MPKKAKTKIAKLDLTKTVAAVQTLEIFAAKAGEKLDAPAKLKRRNRPPLVKPAACPIGGAVTGEIINVVPSPKADIKGELLWLRHASGLEFLFPVTGVIKQALDPDLKKEIGKQFFARRLPDGLSGKYKKAMFMFDVFTSE